MDNNKYISFFDKKIVIWNGNHQYSNTYDHIKNVLTKQFGIQKDKSTKDIQTAKIIEPIKYEKLKYESFLKKNEAITTVLSGIAIPILVVAFATEGNLYSSLGFLGVAIFIFIILLTVILLYRLSLKKIKENTVYNIILKVLDDIEKEMQDEINEEYLVQADLNNALRNADDVLNTCNENLKQAQIVMKKLGRENKLNT